MTLPNLGPTLLFVCVITMIVTSSCSPTVRHDPGGPVRHDHGRPAEYDEGFRWWRMGVAAAIAFFLFAITLAGTLVRCDSSGGAREAAAAGAAVNVTSGWSGS